MTQMKNVLTRAMVFTEIPMDEINNFYITAKDRYFESISITAAITLIVVHSLTNF
jgi:hypothetical protein